MVDFERCHSNWKTYPQNLVSRSMYYTAVLDSLEGQLLEHSSSLFAIEDKDISILFRDMYTGKAAVKYNAINEQKFIERLESPTLETQALDLQSSPRNAIKHPDCRFIFLTAKHGWAALALRYEMAKRLLSFHQVIPDYIELILPFGLQSEHKDISFSTFRSQTTLQPKSEKSMVLPDLRRSGRHFQICYNLKMAGPETDENGVEKEGRWRIRQAAIHHQFDIEEGTALWIVTRGGSDIKERIAELTGPSGRLDARKFDIPDSALRSSIAIHNLLSEWAIENWHRYIQALEDKIKETNIALYHIRREDTSSENADFTAGDVQAAQRKLEGAAQAKIVLVGNSEVLRAIGTYYEELLDNEDFTLRDKVDGDIRRFRAKLNKTADQISFYVKRLEFLETVAEGRKHIITQYVQDQSTRKMESLNIYMHQISAKSHNEAVAMRVITVVTLLFLPATFVSTFFSTGVVNYGNENNAHTFSKLAMERWLQVTLPLTAVTLGLAFVYVERRRRKAKSAIIPDQRLVPRGLGPLDPTEATSLTHEERPHFKQRHEDNEKITEHGSIV